MNDEHDDITWLDNKICLENPTIGKNLTTNAQKSLEKVLITVAVHGNEPCGYHAVNALVREGFFGNEFWTQHPHIGRLVIMIGNPQALERGQRFVDRNLNRLFADFGMVMDLKSDNSHATVSDIYEEHLVGVLAREIDECTAYLDLHSTSAPSPSFCIPCKSSFVVAESLPVQFVLEDLLCSLEGTTLHWAERKDKEKIGVCIECGQHDALETMETAKRGIIQFLGAIGDNELHRSVKTILNCKTAQRLNDGFRFKADTVPHAFQKVKFDEIIAYDNIQGEIKCPFANGAYLIMPTAHSIIGEEAWFWGLDQEQKNEQHQHQEYIP